MKKEERVLIRKLIDDIYKCNESFWFKEKKKEKIKYDFLNNFTVDITKQPEYLKKMFETAYDDHANHDVESLLILTGIFNLFTDSLLDILIKIILEPWHYWHENIASVFEKLKSPRTIETLFTVATNKYDYMPFDGGVRPLIVQCILALGVIDTPEARDKISKIGEIISDPIIKKRAEMQLYGDRGSML